MQAKKDIMQNLAYYLNLSTIQVHLIKPHGHKLSKQELLRWVLSYLITHIFSLGFLWTCRFVVKSCLFVR